MLLFDDLLNYWDSLDLVLVIPHREIPSLYHPAPINNLFERRLEGRHSQFQTCRNHIKTIRGTHQVMIDSKPLLAAVTGCMREWHILKTGGKPNRIWLAQGEEEQAPHQNSTLDQFNCQIKSITIFICDHPRARAQLTLVPHTARSEIGVLFT